ncbi:MAG: chemotaxis protein CheB [Deltaproteobacteria bacterium]|nr:chemotaxis protein CheB [Deltaproteobacteria bacterium]
MANSKDPVRVLIVDDTAFMRRALVDIFSRDADINVVGVASHGQEAIEAIELLSPDVITMDVDMPVMDGITAIKYIMVKNPKPIIMISGMGGHGPVTLEAFKLGAVDFLQKPSGTISLDIHSQAEQLCMAVKQAVTVDARHIKRARLRMPVISPVPVTGRANGLLIFLALKGACGQVMRTLMHLKSSLPVSILVIHDMPPEVLKSYATALSRHVPWGIRVDERGMLQTPVQEEGFEDLSCDIAERFCSERGVAHFYRLAPNDDLDLFLLAVAEKLREKALVVLFGGPSDAGIEGMAAVAEAGGVSLAMSPDICIYPHATKHAIESGAAVQVQTENDLWNRLDIFSSRLKFAVGANEDVQQQPLTVTDAAMESSHAGALPEQEGLEIRTDETSAPLEMTL